MKPTTVRVHWSESYFFPEEEQDYPFEEFEELALKAAMNVTRGYEKTKVTVLFDSGEVYHCRLDLAHHVTLGYRDHMQQLYDGYFDECVGSEWAENFLEFYRRIEWPNKEEAPQ